MWLVWLVFLFVAAAQPAAAREWIHSPNPPILYKSSLNNAQVFLAVDGNSPRHRTTSQLNANRNSWFTFSGVPSGVNLSISNVANHTITGVGEAARVTLSYSGNFSSDWVLTITVSASAYFVRARTVTYTIPVQTDNTKGLWTGAVSGQATEAGGQSTFPVRLRAAPTAAVTVSVSSRDASEGTVAPSSLTFSSTNWSTAQAVTVTGVQDTVDDGDVTWQVRLDPSSGDTGYNGLGNVDVGVTTTDDDGPPGVTLTLNPASIAESGTGNVATVTARLSHASGAATTVTVTGVSGFYAAGTDAAIVIPAEATTAASDTATIVAVDNDTDAPDRTETVTASITNARATADSTTMAVTGAALTVRDDDAAPGATLSLNPASIAEPSGVSTVSATLSHPSSQPSTVTVTAVSGAYTAGTDATIVIAAGSTTAASDTALITAVNDDLHHGNAGRSATVTGTLTNGQGAGAVTGAALTITDDETLPVVSLVLSSSSISENGGIATVTAGLSGLSGKSSEATTVTVMVTPLASSGAVAGDFALSTANTLTIAAGSTTSMGLVTVTGVDNNVDAANKLLRISGTTAGGNGIANPAADALTLTNDDDATATLVLNPSAISENGGISTVTARLSHPTTQAATLTVAAAAGAGAVAADFSLSSTTTLTIAANATTSTGVVTVTAIDNTQATGNKQVTVSATAAGGRGVSNPSDATLILRDDEFGLSESAVSGQATEGGGQATFTVRLNTQPSQAVTVAVSSRDPGEGTVLPSSLTFATGAWNTAQTVTVTGVQDTIDDGTVTWQVRLDPSSGDSDYNAVTDVDVDVTTTDDDGPPTVTMALTPASISENGGISTVTARLSHPSGAATTLTVTAASGFFTVGSGSAGVVVIPAEATTGTDTALVTAVDNDTDSPDRTATVTATVTNARAAADSTTMAVTGASLTIRDDDAAPGVTLALNPTSVSENGGISTVTATLSRPSTEPSTVTVTAVAGAYAAGADATIVIAAGSTTAASDTALVTAVNDQIHQGTAGRSATVTATLANGQGAGAVTGAALTLTDDETLPTAALALGPSSISENGGVATVTATLSGPSSEAVTVTVAAAAVLPATAADFTQAGTTLTVAAGRTTSAGLVTVRGNDNDVDAANKTVTVSGTTAGGNNVANPSSATLTLTDDEDTATATLALTPRAILENGEVSTVTARLSHPTTEATTLTVSSAPVAPATAADFMQSSTSTLTIAAGATTSAGLVTITSVDNTVASGRKRVTVSATAAGGRGVMAPANATLTIRDDEFGLDESAASGPVTEGGGTATFTVALQTQPSAAVTVSVTSLDATEGRVAPSSLVFTVQNWETARTVTVTGADDDVDDGDVDWQVRLDASSGDVNYDGLDDVDVDVTTTDDDGPPTVTLALDPASILENGGISTVTAKLSHPSVQPTTVTVTAAPVSPAAADDFTLSPATTLTIAARSISSAGLVTVTGNDNRVDAANKTVRISGAAENGMGVGAVTGADLTIADDDEKGFAFTPAAVEAERGGNSVAYTVALKSEPNDDVTVTVVEGNESLSANPGLLTFVPDDWNAPQTVTVTARGEGNGYAREGSWVSHAASGGGYGDVRGELPVSVRGETVIEVTPGTTAYAIEGREVEVTVEGDVPEGIEVDFEGVGSSAPAGKVTTMTIKGPDVSPDATAAADAPDDDVNLGPEGSRTVMDIDVAVDGGLVTVTVKLPVKRELFNAAEGRKLLLLRHGDSGWEPVIGAEYNSETRLITATLTEYSPFAVGYADTKPTFGDHTIEAMVFTVGEDIGRVVLPPVTGGDEPFKYDLSPEDPPPGLDIDREARVLSGTPTEEMEETPYTWTATDADGQVAPLEFTIEVVPALDKARARLAAINRSVLPELSRATWGSVVDAVTRRLESPGGGVLASGLAGAASMLRSNERALEEGAASWKDLLAGESFVLSLGSPAGSSPAAAWGSGERRRLSLDKEALDWSGDLFAAHAGVDAPLGGGLRGGLAASWFESAIKYVDRSGEAPIAGVHDSRMAAAHPYLGWSGPDGSRLWGALGYGEGEIEITDAEVAERFGVQKGDSAFLGVAAGGAVPVLSADGLALALKAAGEATRYSVKDNGSAIAAVSAKTQRLRLAAEGTRTYALPGGGTLAPSLEMGARWDGGDGETGLGVEVGGGLSWASDSLAVEARGRALAAHEGDVEEWGAAASARLSPGSGGRGLSLSLSPRWGASESGLARLWDEGMAASGGTGGARLEAELGYGFRAWAGSATPYAGFGYEDGGARRYRLGTRFAFGPDLAIGLEAERKEVADDPEHGARIELRLGW